MANAQDNTVLVLAPVGQDAPAMAALLQAQGIPTRVCCDPADCVAQMRAGSGALLLTEESLELPEAPALFSALKAQPAWSELPLLILTRGGEQRVTTLLDLAASAAGAVTLLERPMGVTTLLRSVEVALRSRSRQYEVRDLLVEQQRRERELRESEQRYRLLFDKNPDGVFSVDPGGRFTAANTACEKISGYSVEELVQKTFVELCAPDCRARTQQHFEETVNQPHYSELETALIRKDGSRVEVWIAGEPLMAEGKVTAVHCTAKDITARKQAEERLRQVHQRLEYHIQNTPLAVIEFDPELRIRAWSAGAQRIFGWEPSEVLGRAMWEVPWICEEDRAKVQHVADGLTSGQTARSASPNRNLRKDGTVIWCEWYNSSLTDAQGRMQSIQSLVLDVTERKRIEEALRVSEQTARQQWAELEAIYSAAPVGLCVFDRQLRYRRINQRMAEINGAPVEAHIGKTAHEVVPSLANQAEEMVRQVTSSRKPVRFEFKGQTPAQPGVERVWDEQWFPLGDGDEVQEIGVVVQDITDRKQFQSELERLVAERTTKLQELVSELEHFSYTITHDMRAPLRAMQGFAEMFAEAYTEGQQQDAQRFLERIRTAANRMDALIVDALSYSEAIRKHLPLAPIDPGLLLRGMLDTYPELHGPNVRIQVESGIPLVFANEAGLTQVFSNLLNNAIKFAKPGQPAEIRVWAQLMPRASDAPADPLAGPNPTRSVGFTPMPSQPGPGNGLSRQWVRISIEDNGIGISRTMLPRVFNMFTRGVTEKAGTGIGLALVRKVVDRMGGRVGVESQESQGSRFWVELVQAS